MLKVLKRVTPVARHILFVGAVALLLASGASVAKADPNGPGGGLGGSVPEISLGAVGGAMTLLAGGLALVRERLRSR